MTQEIIKSIQDAEAQAQAVKQAALLQAEEIVKQAERAAAKEGETMDEVCRAYKNSQLKDAEKIAEKAYEQALENQREQSATACSKILEESEPYVGVIIGRIIRGDC